MVLLLRGFMRTLPTALYWVKTFAPSTVHDAPASVLLRIPLVLNVRPAKFRSPVPAYTVSWLFGSRVTSSTEVVEISGSSSSGVQLVSFAQQLVVFHTPPP